LLLEFLLCCISCCYCGWSCCSV